MKKYLKLALTAALALPLVATTAIAQNYNLRPSYGAISLQAGFLPDPVTRSMRAGGDHHFRGGGGCPGGAWFANAPDYRLHYRAGGYALSFYVRAPGDTAMLVNDPTGTWYCNDDYQGLNPGVVFNNPRSGQYDVWLGTYNRSRVGNSVLYITEMGAFSR
ncbi:MAG TPA: peptidase S1 [Paracoccus sp.]|nr:peptidase S1 [Paracoccus sp. (in: a-proteobacteria)]